MANQAVIETVLEKEDQAFRLWVANQIDFDDYQNLKLVAQFYNGARVFCETGVGYDEVKQQFGIVRGEPNEYGQVAVEFDEYINGHELHLTQPSGKIKPGHGWYVKAIKLQLIES